MHTLRVVRNFLTVLKLQATSHKPQAGHNRLVDCRQNRKENNMTLKAPLVEEEKKKQIKNSPNHYEVFSRNYIEKLVCDFVNKNQIVAHYGKDDDGIFEVRFKVKEVSDE
tara:strand:- start:44 stop:373 length:330 start_codon:yes stop_codon:yes gene_type:complete